MLTGVYHHPVLWCQDRHANWHIIGYDTTKWYIVMWKDLPHWWALTNHSFSMLVSYSRSGNFYRLKFFCQLLRQQKLNAWKFLTHTFNFPIYGMLLCSTRRGSGSLQPRTVQQAVWTLVPGEEAIVWKTCDKQQIVQNLQLVKYVQSIQWEMMSVSRPEVLCQEQTRCSTLEHCATEPVDSNKIYF